MWISTQIIIHLFLSFVHWSTFSLSERVQVTFVFTCLWCQGASLWTIHIEKTKLMYSCWHFHSFSWFELFYTSGISFNLLNRFAGNMFGEDIKEWIKITLFSLSDLDLQSKNDRNQKKHVQYQCYTPNDLG